MCFIGKEDGKQRRTYTSIAPVGNNIHRSRDLYILSKVAPSELQSAEKGCQRGYPCLWPNILPSEIHNFIRASKKLHTYF